VFSLITFDELSFNMSALGRYHQWSGGSGGFGGGLYKFLMTMTLEKYRDCFQIRHYRHSAA